MSNPLLEKPSSTHTPKGEPAMIGSGNEGAASIGDAVPLDDSKLKAAWREEGRMRLVIVESPFAGDVERNLRYVRAAMRDCFMRGEAPFASHLLYAAPLVARDIATRVKLTRGYETKVDASDKERVSAFKWLAAGRDGQVYAARHQRVTAGGQLTILLHRFLMDAAPGEDVDHIDGDPLNNQRINLRRCSHRNNSRNVRRPKSNTSGFKGVSKQGTRWRAAIVVDGRQLYLGSYVDPISAAKAYDVAALKWFGQFARLNCPPLASVLDDNNPAERKQGIAAGLAWGRHADLTVVYTDLGISGGMALGIQAARDAGRPVECRTLPEWFSSQSLASLPEEQIGKVG